MSDHLPPSRPPVPPSARTAQSGVKRFGRFWAADSGHSVPAQMPSGPWGGARAAAEVGLARRVGLSFPTRLRSGPDESLGVSAGTGATQDCPRHGPAPGQGAPGRGPRGQRAGARAHACGHRRAAASPPGPGASPADSQSFGPPRPSCRSRTWPRRFPGRRRVGWAWSCPGHSGLCVHRRGLPGGCPVAARQKRPRQGALGKPLPRTPNPARAPGAGSAPLMACGGVGRPSCSPSCPQDPAPCSSGGLGWGCRQQTLGRSGLCRHPGHADRHPGFTPRNARWVAQFLPARDPVCISLGHGGRCQGVLRCLAEAPPQACGDPQA